MSDDKGVVMFPERVKSVKPPLSADIPDHRIITYALEQALAPTPNCCILITSDREMTDIAETLSVLVVMPDSRSERFHAEIKRKCDWWQKLQDQKPVSTPKPKTIKQPERRYERFVKHLYGQVRANHHRTVLAVSTLKARVGLTVQLIQRVRNHKRRVVLVVVPNKADMAYWDEQLRKVGGFQGDEIQVFGHGIPGKLEKARAVIYAHTQVGRRLPQHIDRLAQADQKLTAVVCGCDLLDPVGLAHLLFECDQFIGMTYYPLDRTSTPSDRLLNGFLRGKSVLSHSFADAERDGWGKSFDVYPHAVQFTPDSLQLWNELNVEYLRLRETLSRQRPELLQSADFWQALVALMENAAVPRAGRLFELREQLEQQAQQEPNKRQVLLDTLGMIRSAKHHTRHIVYDFEGLWSPVITKLIAEEGYTVASLPTDETQQRKVWQQFVSRKINVLLVSNRPAHQLPPAHIAQLVIMTPLQPLASTSAIVDWALTHTTIPQALRIELLYVQHSAEEVAMHDLAETCFDLRYQY